MVDCKYDFYPCGRNLCCFSRFYLDFCCSRYVKVNHSFNTPRKVVRSSRSLLAIWASSKKR
jgi:hypothetical protein